jgi:hypothetical protein
LSLPLVSPSLLSIFSPSLFPPSLRLRDRPRRRGTAVAARPLSLSPSLPLSLLSRANRGLLNLSGKESSQYSCVMTSRSTYLYSVVNLHQRHQHLLRAPPTNLSGKKYFQPYLTLHLPLLHPDPLYFFPTANVTRPLHRHT